MPAQAKQQNGEQVLEFPILKGETVDRLAGEQGRMPNWSKAAVFDRVLLRIVGANFFDQGNSSLAYLANKFDKTNGLGEFGCGEPSD
ncbi:hypothetical protein [Egbenema bharatensis]|uniref:hypothetical protein n=1 Tax=Egbenema bharatensis TaxID=3463334 RepID=UPI003A86361D